MTKCLPIIALLLLVPSSVSLGQSQQPGLLDLTGPYLGQKPPGLVPEVFGPGVISTDDWEFSITFSKNGEELLFSRRQSDSIGNRLFYMKIEEGKWSVPHSPPFALDCREFEPNFAPDGMHLYYNSRRPLPGDVNSPHPFNLWIVYKQETDWSEPEMIGSPIMELFPMFATQGKDGTLYFTGNIERGIYSAEYKDGNFVNPHRLPDVINSCNSAGHPFIDPDERFLIFDSNIDEQGTKNLYVSFNNKGKWTESINMNQFYPFPEHAAIPYLSFDGKYLFFTSRGDIWWVDAQIIHELKK